MELEWVRGHTLGRGRFGTVSLAIPTNSSSEFQPLMAVKSCEVSKSESLKIEKEVLSSLGDCPEIIRLFGDGFSIEKGTQFYNLFLEYACNGSLSDHVGNSGGTLVNSDVKRYTKSILRGLCHIHEKGFAHCDIKLENILVFEGGLAKIADFGLAKRIAEDKKKKKNQLRGTPLYLSPELVAGDDGGPPADIWAFGCSIVEMVSGKPAWNCSPESDISSLIYRIGMGQESPAIPSDMCSDGKDFLGKCFVRDPNERWTARMLLDHPFISGYDDREEEQPSVSPRCPFDLSDWDSMGPSTPDPILFCTGSEFKLFEEGEWGDDSGCRVLHSGCLDEFVGGGSMPDWCDSDGWVTIR